MPTSHPQSINGTTDTVDTTSSATITSDQKATRLALGDHSDSVTKMQERLTELQYFNSAVTNYFGPLTESAVKLFQEKMDWKRMESLA